MILHILLIISRLRITNKYFQHSVRFLVNDNFDIEYCKVDDKKAINLTIKIFEIDFLRIIHLNQNMRNRRQIDNIIEILKGGGKISQNQVKIVCESAISILSQQQNVVMVQSPVTICGDIHGQFDDLIELFKVSGYPPYCNYVFLGDYVDRGRDSVQTFLLLLALKVRYKRRITLLRGNHQTKLITQVYGFYDECIRKYGSVNVWKHCIQVFNYLNIAAVIQHSVFCVHGGLSPRLRQIQDIDNFDRIKQVPQNGLMSDLLWSDPEQSIQGWKQSTRGAGYLFGNEVTEQFCHKNNIELIARAHQLVMQGYKFMFDENLVTVWSAPNYSYRCGNVASVLQLDEKMQKFFKIFEEAPIKDRINEKGQAKSVPHYFL